MWARRPKYDDTFGVRMDLGADCMDPISARPAPKPHPASARQTVIVEEPRSVFGIFRRPDTLDGRPPVAVKPAPARTPHPVPTQPEMNTPARPASHPAADWRTRSAPAGGAQGAGSEQVAAAAMRFWKKLSLQHKIMIGTFAVWFLFATGLVFPAVVLAVILVAVRNQKKATR